LGRVCCLGARAASRGSAGATGNTVVAALIAGVTELIAYGIAAAGKLWNFAASGVFRIFVSLLPRADLWRGKAQFFMAEHMQLETARALHFLHTSVHV